jgi:hypothetical protein
MNTSLRILTHSARNALGLRVRSAVAAFAVTATFGLVASAAADHAVDTGTDASNNGPLITVEAPRLDEAPVSAPVTIALAWSAQDGAAVDLDSFRVWYKLGFASKNVTERVLSAMRNAEGSRFDAAGLFVPNANLPSGRHRLVIELADTRSRRSYTELEFQVARR